MALNALFWVGYVLLIGPPRAVEIRCHAERIGDDLRDKPIWLVIVAEFTMRSALFLVAVVSIESLLGDQLYEQYQLDFFCGALILAGIIHTIFYCVSCYQVQSAGHMQSRVYRLGRNFAYAIIPAFVCVGFVLVWQDFKDIELFSEGYAEQTFLISWLLFLLLGLTEALVMKRSPRCLGIMSSNNIK